MGSEPSKSLTLCELEEEIVAEVNAIHKRRTIAPAETPSSIDEFDEPRFADRVDLVDEDLSVSDSGSLDEHIILEDEPPTFKTLNQWQKITSDWEKWTTKKKSKLKKLIRKGIPEVARHKVWKKLVGFDVLRDEMEANHPGYYLSLLNRSPKVSAAVQIAKDITRTMPSHPRFQTRQGQRELENVLRAFAVHDPELGYCQGMGFLVCMFLLYYSEEDSFYCLMVLLNDERFAMRCVFLPNLPGVHERCFQFQTLLERCLPRVCERFEDCLIEPHFYSAAWFMTMFTSNCYNFPQARRIWDVYLAEGLKIQFRIGLAILKVHEAEILQADENSICSVLQNLEVPEDVLTHAFTFKITRAQLARASKKHRDSQRQECQV